MPFLQNPKTFCAFPGFNLNSIYSVCINIKMYSMKMDLTVCVIKLLNVFRDELSEVLKIAMTIM